MVTIDLLWLQALVPENLFHYVVLISVRNFSVGLARRQSGTPVHLLLFASVHGPIHASVSVGLVGLLPGGRGFVAAHHLLDLRVISRGGQPRGTKILRQQPALVIVSGLITLAHLAESPTIICDVGTPDLLVAVLWRSLVVHGALRRSEAIGHILLSHKITRFTW